MDHAFFDYGQPYDLLGVGALCTLVGLLLFRKALTGDTLFPGTLWTHIPAWLLWTLGVLLQLPLLLAIYFLHMQKLL